MQPIACNIKNKHIQWVIFEELTQWAKIQESQYQPINYEYIAAAVPDFKLFVGLQNINIILFAENPFYSVIKLWSMRLTNSASPYPSRFSKQVIEEMAVTILFCCRMFR